MHGKLGFACVLIHNYFILDDNQCVNSTPVILPSTSSLSADVDQSSTHSASMDVTVSSPVPTTSNTPEETGSIIEINCIHYCFVLSFNACCITVHHVCQCLCEYCHVTVTWPTMVALRIDVVLYLLVLTNVWNLSNMTSHLWGLLTWLHALDRWLHCMRCSAVSWCYIWAREG